MLIYFLIFSMSLILTFLVTPFIRYVALKFDVVDKRATRKIHRKVITKLGGMAIYAAVVFATTSCLFMEYRVMKPYMWSYGVILIAATLVLCLGIYDDVRGANPIVKLCTQLLAGVILINYDIYFTEIEFLWFQFDLGVIAIPFTLLFVVGITNAINLLDGIDGLAAGVVGIISVGFFVNNYLSGGNTLTTLLSIGLAGACFGFLQYNFYPARIFMGDTGSLFLGFMIASMAVMNSKAGTHNTLGQTFPFIAMLLPVIDTTTVFSRRLWKRVHPFQADKRHVHHRLIRGGLSQRSTCFILYGVTGMFVLLGLYLEAKVY